MSELEYVPFLYTPEQLHARREAFVKDLTSLINYHSRENGSDTPDFMLAAYLMACLDAFDLAVRDRDAWYGHRGFKDAVEPPAPAPDNN